jgi:hypothetical protein
MPRNREPGRLGRRRHDDRRSGRGLSRPAAATPTGRPTRCVSSAESVPARGQHARPCGDCPWRRDALPGWLGSLSPEAWVAAARGEAIAECHTRTGAQCAGFAIFRTNICKVPRDPEALRLPADRETVFATAPEFLNYHHGLKEGADE